jgi:DMSO/TMAO reductase YedYZ molybdopterin-dependent catalytic subunit
VFRTKKMLDTLLEGVETAAAHAVQFCDGGYTTYVPLDDITGGKAWVVFAYDGKPLEPEHGDTSAAAPQLSGVPRRRGS